MTSTAICGQDDATTDARSDPVGIAQHLHVGKDGHDLLRALPHVGQSFVCRVELHRLEPSLLEQEGGVHAENRIVFDDEDRAVVHDANPEFSENLSVRVGLRVRGILNSELSKSSVRWNERRPTAAGPEFIFQITRSTEPAQLSLSC